MPDAAELSLTIRDYEFLDIKSCTVTRAIDQIADEVRVELANTWPQTGTLALPFQEGDDLELRVDGELWLTGFVAQRSIQYGPSGHAISVSGLSNTAHLSTSCHEGPPRVWKDVPLPTIINDVCRPYGIGVNIFAQSLGENFTRFAASVGEMAFNVIRRACTKRGVWATSNEEGDLEIIEAGQDRVLTTIIGQGVPGQTTNVLEMRSEASYTDTYSHVIVTGQSSSSATWKDEEASKGYALYKIPWVTKHRPLVIHETSESGKKKLQRRAEWEARTRIGRSRSLSATLQGYLGESELPVPAPWRPNTRVVVIDGLLDVDDEFLIERVTSNFTQSGTTTMLDLVAPEAYEVLAPPPKSKTTPRDRKGRFLPWA